MAREDRPTDERLPLPNFRFAERGRLWFTISAAIILIGLISLAVQGLNLGVDFTGGSVLELDFVQPVTAEEMEEVIAEYPVMRGAMVQRIGEETIRIRSPQLPEGDEREEMYANLEELGEYEIAMLDEVSPVIGRELTRDGMLAVAIAIVGMVAYITIRFEYRFAVCAIAALIHDSVLTLGLFSIMQVEIDSAFIAAVLTIVGYSVNDTIVIFDRVRENIRYRKTGEYLDQMVNRSIRQSLMRSLATSLTTFVAIGALAVFGGAALRNFTIALLIGVVVGTYSSLFIASPLWVLWQKVRPSKLISQV